MRELLAVKGRFYDVLIDGADSSVLATMLSSLQARVSLLRATSLTREGRPLEMLTRAAHAGHGDQRQGRRRGGPAVRRARPQRQPVTGMAELEREGTAVLA